MAQIYPFNALLYHSARVKDASRVLCPPYDVMTRDQAAEMRARDAHQFARIILKDPDASDYHANAVRMREWQQEGYLSKEKPALYLYRQRFFYGERMRERHAWMVAVLLEELGAHHVFGHEHIYPVFADDRTEIMRTLQMQLSPVFGLVKASGDHLVEYENAISCQTPCVQAASAYDQGEHTLWQVPSHLEPLLLDKLQSACIVIADGHHRYQAAYQLAERNGALGKPAQAESQVLMALVQADDPGLLVLPTHRSLKEAPPWEEWRKRAEDQFEITRLTRDQALTFTLEPTHGPIPQFVACAGGDYWHLTVKEDVWHRHQSEEPLQKELATYWSDAVIGHRWLNVSAQTRYAAISYDHAAADALRRKAAVTFLHAPLSVNTIMELAQRGCRMPQKSTYFFPKLASGVCCRVFK